MANAEADRAPIHLVDDIVPHDDEFVSDLVNRPGLNEKDDIGPTAL
jgi:hypothetical protein